MKKKIIKIIDKIKENNSDLTLTWCFILTCLLNGIILRVVTVKNVIDIKPFLVDLGFLFLISIFSFLLKPKKRFTYYLIWSIILTAICVINSIYYTYYTSFASISLLATSIFIKDVGNAVTETIFEFKDIIYIWEPLFLIYIYYFHTKKKLINLEHKKSIIKELTSFTIITLTIAIILMPSIGWSRFTKMWNRESVVRYFGIYVYQFNDLFQSLEPKINNLFGHDNAYKVVSDYYENKESKKISNEYTNIFEGKNILFIHAESVQGFTMSLSFYDKEVTPNLNTLASSGLYFSNFYSQVGVGTSSDTEFTLNTSLMPSSSGTVFVNYFDREYVTIEKLLKEKGYYTFSMHANNGDFWNRATMHKNMGYDKFYDKSSYVIDETIGLGLSDKSFFNQSIPILKEISENNNLFMGTIIMLSNHTPFSDLDLMDEYDTTWTVNINGEEITRDYLQDTELGNYIRSVHYADQALGEFIDNLDKEGLLDNTVLVIYGDHDSRISKKYFDILYNYDPYTDTILTEEDMGYTKQNDYTYEINRKVPLIIWSKDIDNKKIDTPMGMIDVMPTLGNMFNFYNKYKLGTDIFNVMDNTVVFTNGSYLTKKIYYNAQKSEIYSINGEAVDEEYINTNSEYASKIIEISNYIITYDLIKEIEEKGK